MHVEQARARPPCLICNGRLIDQMLAFTPLNFVCNMHMGVLPHGDNHRSRAINESIPNSVSDGARRCRLGVPTLARRCSCGLSTFVGSIWMPSWRLRRARSYCTRSPSLFPTWTDNMPAAAAALTLLAAKAGSPSA